MAKCNDSTVIRGIKIEFGWDFLVFGRYGKVFVHWGGSGVEPF
jgi:hypothetical protein